MDPPGSRPRPASRRSGVRATLPSAEGMRLRYLVVGREIQNRERRLGLRSLEFTAIVSQRFSLIAFNIEIIHIAGATRSLTIPVLHSSTQRSGSWRVYWLRLRTPDQEPKHYRQFRSHK